MSTRLKRLLAELLGVSLLLQPVVVRGFSDVSGSTSYRTAIDAMEKKGVIEGYADGTFQSGNRINRAEFLKIILEARGDFGTGGTDCFPDVHDEWYAKYVCAAKDEEIIQGYPDGLFRPERETNFVEASKILSLAYKQQIDTSSPDWYEPYARALESSKAIPPSIDNLDRKITRGEMVEMMWRLDEGKLDQPTKGYLNVKYPSMKVNLASDTPQRAVSCIDLQAFAEEAARSGAGGGRMMFEDMAMPTTAPSDAVNQEAPLTGGGADYSDTNVQVAGVDEADIVKTDGSYLYIVSNTKVRIVVADGSAALDEVATIDLEEVGLSPSDLYIHDDRLVVLGTRWQGGVGIMDERMGSSLIWPGYGYGKAEARIYDVSDRSNPELERKVAFDGSLTSSRRIDDKLYMIVNQPVRWGGPMPLSNVREGDVMPMFEDSNDGNEAQPVGGCNDVMILPHVPSPQYLTVGVIPLDNPEMDVEREVVLGNAENVYASLENLYIATTEYRYTWEVDAQGPTVKTNAYRFEFTDSGIEMEAQGSAPGRILNQFSMDEHEGNFRIATTTDPIWGIDSEIVASSNAVYVLSADMNTIGSIEGIAPGERIYSARFMGDRAYLVTFKQVDPLFVIDLSSPRDPKILGKLKIPGVSDYLHPYDETHLIGFGREAVEGKDMAWFQGMKISLFDVADVANPREVASTVIGDRGTSSPLLYNHKALLFDKERGLIAFPVSVYSISEADKKAGNESAYGTQTFQGAYVYDFSLSGGFKLRGTITHYTDEDIQKSGDSWYMYGKDVERVVRIGEKLYTISQDAVKQNALASLKEEGMVEFKD